MIGLFLDMGSYDFRDGSVLALLVGHEAVLGELLAGAPDPKRTFIATKVWTRGSSGRHHSDGALLHAAQGQAHRPHASAQSGRPGNASRDTAALEAGRPHPLLGRVTHYTASAYDELEAVMRSETLDFVQLNYSLDDRAAERKLLPLAADRGIAILVNLPFGGGGLLRRLGNRPLPEWAGEMGCTSWAQILLKFVLAHPAVTCAIPGTGNPAHMADNCRAGSGMLPDVALRKRIIADWEASN
jgi:aryl-alcohol dehydrogenase-like predicted oxidoreductase